MSFYRESLIKSLQEKIAYFRDASLHEEAKLLQARLNSLEKKPVESTTAAPDKIQTECHIAETARRSLRAKLAAETHHIPELEKQYILENLNSAGNLKELEPLRIAYMERLLKISRANRSKKIPLPSVSTELSAGPYNNEKTFSEALQLIYSQDPLWIEDLKELYFSIMPLSSVAATSKSPL
ncbi:MAG: hypothetical protein LBQ87_07675 [Candidatus Fibromonas sp.]|jgi:hypothetical protein|nr:hypothetical protein [Candidatus Fibromonas sp.]